MELPRPNGLITLLSDFGHEDPYVGLMKGMILRQHGRAQIVDLAHGVPPQDVHTGALFLATAIERFPAGTVHVAVVDPGVGTERRAIVACRHQCYWIGPDNGLLGAVLPEGDDGEVRAVDAASLGLVPQSRTFHGRDLFAPLAGLFSSQRCGFRAVGPRIDDPVRLPAVTEAPQVLFVDHFGNLVTNVGEQDAQGIAGVEISGQFARLLGTYAEARPGELLALVNSYGLLEIARRGGRADLELRARAGEPVRIRGGSA